MDLRELFAFNLRRLRHASGLSQEGLAHDSKINRSYMSRLERGVAYVGLEIIGKLADALKVQPTEFLRPRGKKRAAPKKKRSSV